MATEPTIEEAKAVLRGYLDDYGVRTQRTSVAAALSTLLASHASLEERVEEAKRLMKPFAEAAENLDDTNDFDDDELWEHAAAMGLHVRDLRALAAFVNEKERT